MKLKLIIICMKKREREVARKHKLNVIEMIRNKYRFIAFPMSTSDSIDIFPNCYRLGKKAVVVVFLPIIDALRFKN